MPFSIGDKLKALRIEPSEQTWQRLEKKLDYELGLVRSLRRRRRLMFAAGWLLLILAAGFFINEISSEKEDHYASLFVPPARLQELPESKGCEPYCLTMKARRELPKYYQLPAAKGI